LLLDLTLTSQLLNPASDIIAHSIGNVVVVFQVLL